MKVLYSTGSAAAVPFFKHAIEIDPKFAMGHAMLGRVYGSIGESFLSAESTSKAYQLRDRASDKEKFFISASYDRQVTGNLQKAQQTCELWVQAYPRDRSPHGFLAGLIYPLIGKYEESVEEAKTTIGLDPDFFVGYAILANSDLALGRTDEAENALQEASQRKLEVSDFSLLRYYIAFLKGDKTGMEREAAQAVGKPGLEDSLSNAESSVLAYSGHLEEARKMSRRATDLALEADRPELAAHYEADAAGREALFGNESAARQRVMVALGLSKGRGLKYGASFLLALAGDSSRSQALADDLANRFPEDTRLVFAYLPTVRALLALNQREPSEAVELLQTASPYELGTVVFASSMRLGPLYPVYVRGEAYLAARQGREAAVEFQKILDHRGIVVSDPIGALAHLQIGRAYAMEGDTAKAKAAYQDFLTLWKDADPDIPILIAAKAEYAKLK
jgi:eukaryotic-like serine/threonine-protein kinase